MTHDMKEGLFQPRWRRMKEKPPARNPGPSKKTPLQKAQENISWPETAVRHRIDKQPHP